MATMAIVVSLAGAMAEVLGSAQLSSVWTIDKGFLLEVVVEELFIAS